LPTAHCHDLGILLPGRVQVVEVDVVRIRRAGGMRREVDGVVVALQAVMRSDLVVVAHGQNFSGWAAPKKALYRPAVIPAA
jgi:hypothetical protein